MTSATETVLTNAEIVLRDRTIRGTLVVRNGAIAEIDEGRSAFSGAVDLAGDLLIPGLIEMHTDNLERNFQPRPKVTWPSARVAVMAHDVQVAGSAITTVFDAVRVGNSGGGGSWRKLLEPSVLAISEAQRDGHLRADHYLHLRCEISDPAVVEEFDRLVDHPLARLYSVMDHTPDQRQWRDLEKFRTYLMGKGYTEDQLAAHIVEKKAQQQTHAEPNRKALAERFLALGHPVASHDDTTEAHVDEAVRDGATISEFPTTMEAARAARRAGMAVVMGAPNLVRGGSHSGNVSAEELADAGLLTGLSSDYVPTSLLEGVVFLHRRHDMPLQDAVAVASANVAEMVGLPDRGVLEPGRRADMVHVHLHDTAPVVRQVWREGRRVL